MLNVRWGTVQNEAGPVVVLKQEAGVGFRVICHTELDENALFNRDVAEQKLDNAVLTPLGVDLEFILMDKVGVLQFTQAALHSPDCLVQFVHPDGYLTHSPNALAYSSNRSHHGSKRCIISSSQPW
jgi:hypothetical protein